MLLTREQFQKARASGFTTDQIIRFEKRRGVTGTWEEQPMQITSPVQAAMKSVSDLTGGAFPSEYWFQRMPKAGLGKYEIGGMGLPHAEAMRKAGEVVSPIEQAEIKGVPAQLAYGGVQAAPIVAGVTQPFMAGAGKVLGAASKIPGISRIAGMPMLRSALGFGGYEATKAGVTGRPIIPAAKGGAISGATYHLGGRLGATAGQIAQPLTKHAPRIGSAVGAGGAAALMAPEGEKISSAMIGGAFGARHPAKPFGYKSPATLAKKATSIYRNLLRPTQSEIKNVEIRKGGNIDEYYRLAAKENLPISQSSDRKLDTADAREMLAGKIEKVHTRLDKILQQDKTTRFDLVKIAGKAIRNARKSITNTKELNSTIEDIVDYTRAEAGRYGRHVGAATMNRIKQGMWSQGYQELRPTSKESARRIGFVAKEAIENAFPDKNIRKLNQTSGEYATLSGLLKKAHGRVVKGGRLGGYAARGIGAIAGSKIPIIGPVFGAYVGGKAADIIYAPKTATKIAAGKMKKAQAMSREGVLDKLGGVITEKVKEVIPDRGLRKVILAEAGKTKITPEMKVTVTEGELTGEPKQLTAPKPFNPYQKLLSGRRQYGQSSSLVIAGQPQPRLPAPKTRPVFGQPETSEVIQAPSPYKKLSYRSPEKGAKLQGEAPWRRGFTVEIGQQKKGIIGKKGKVLREEAKVPLKVEKPPEIKKPILSVPKIEKPVPKGEKATYKIKLAKEWKVPSESTKGIRLKTLMSGTREGDTIKAPPMLKKATSSEVISTLKSTLTDVEVSQQGNSLIIKGYPKKNLGKAEQSKLSKFGTIIAGLATGAMAGKAEAALPKDEDAIKAILGEVGPYGKEGMQWVASSIRNRNNKLQGIYGHKNPNVVNKKYTSKQYKEAREAWKESKTKKFTDSKNWFSDADLKQSYVQRIIEKEKLEFIKKVGGNSFYRKPSK